MEFGGPFSPSLRVDPLSGIFLLVTAFVWWVASLYAPEYMNHEGREGRFTLWLLLTQTAVLGGIFGWGPFDPAALF